MLEINGKTRICGIFGYPVEHSFSPAMHNAAFKEMSLDWTYVPFAVRPEGLAGAVRSIKDLNLAGVNVTVPHKQAVAGLVDRLSPAARLSGAVNTIVNSGGVLTGHNTDGMGFVRSLEEEVGTEITSGPALIIGAGGAARAVAVALALNGAPSLLITNRTGERAADLCELINSNTGCRASVLGWPEPSPQGGAGWAEALGSVALMVQTTSIGMHPNTGEFPPVPFNLLNRGHVVVDLIYNPGRTAFMKLCEAVGCRVFNGIGMLLHQGVMAFELWTGRTPPVDVMREALQRCLEGRMQNIEYRIQETGENYDL